MAFCATCRASAPCSVGIVIGVRLDVVRTWMRSAPLALQAAGDAVESRGVGLAESPPPGDNDPLALRTPDLDAIGAGPAEIAGLNHEDEYSGCPRHNSHRRDGYRHRRVR